MSSNIIKVIDNSLAEKIGIEAGDKLISINDTLVKDIIDYRFLLSDEILKIEIEKNNGKNLILEVEKEYHEDLGIEFQESIMDKAKSCQNNCVFCFVDQLPKGMRPPLYFKDDDSRLSFLQGNFITLTNMKEEDIERIINYRISPINISVHTTNPELRVKMLNNKFAGNILETMKKLSEARIKMNCQIVLCPGFNDGIELTNTIKDLYTLYPHVENVAVVPVGTTKYREGLPKLTMFDSISAKKELDSVKLLQNKFIKEINSAFVRLSDEFYVLSGEKIPKNSFYDGFEQLEDGVGMLRVFRDNIKENIKHLNKRGKGSFLMITGFSAYNEILYAASNIKNKNRNINIEVKRIKNNFFGENITVSGLITGTDIMEQVDKDLDFDYILMPQNMFKCDTSIMLDNVTQQDLEKYFQKPVLVCNYTGDNLIELLNQHLGGECK